MASLAEKRVADDEVTPADPQVRPEELRLLEALLFASAEPIDQATLAKRMPDGVDIKAALTQLQAEYAPRGVNLVRVANKWTFRTAGDLSWLMTRESTETRRLSRAAIEVLAIIAYHQPVTRAEIEEIRGVVTSKGTLDVLLETGWIRLRGRRKAPGRPITYGTTDRFLVHFGLEQISDLPGLEELKGAGLFDGRLPPGFGVPKPDDGEALTADEDPLDSDDTAEDFPLLAHAEDAEALEEAEAATHGGGEPVARDALDLAAEADEQAAVDHASDEYADDVVDADDRDRAGGAEAAE